MTAGNSTVIAPERTVVATRVFDAPRELVYQAWTDPKQLAQWFPPEGFTAPRCEVDPRPGGVFRIVMKGPEGEPFNGAEFPGEGVFREVVPNERLAFTFAGADEVPPPVLVTVLFESQGNKTKLTIQQTAETVADYDALLKLGVREGLAQSLGKLAGVLSGNSTDRGVAVLDRTLTLTRVFNAPRELVWTVLTDPKHMTKWMFANDWESPFAETDLRKGGAFRVGMRPADHSHDGFVLGGTYREIVKPERIVQVIGDGRVMTTTLDEVLGGTKLTLSLEMAMSEEQERAGYTQILDHFAAYLATLTGTK